MRLRSSNAFWLLKNGLVYTYPSLKDDVTCDVLIVGGGITGALMAFQFSSEGYSTVLIDKHDVSFGSTAATTAMLQYELDRPLFQLIETLGTEIAVDIYSAGVVAIHRLGSLIASRGIECGFAFKKSLYIARNDQDRRMLTREFEAREKNGLDVKWISEKDMLNQFGVVGSGGILSGVGATADAYKLSHELLQHSIVNHGLRVFDHTGLVETRYEGELNIAITDDRFKINARHMVYATGYETQSFLNDKIVDLNSTYVTISEPLDEMPPGFANTIFWTTDKPYLYMRSTIDNRILIGGEDESMSDPNKRDALIDAKEKVLIEKMERVMPYLNIVPDFSWAGTFGVTKDALPYIGPHADFPRCHFVLGFGGNGITFSVLGMDIISDAIAGRPNKFLEYFRFNR